MRVLIQVNTSGEPQKYGLDPDEVVNFAREILSMGLSGDYEYAIEEGATELRLGRALFGPRPIPDSFYRPQADSR